MKKIILSFAFIFTAALASAQYTLIPDEHFEQALIDIGHDDVIDGQVLTANISSVEELDIPGLDIQDLTGIESFSNIKELWVSSNALTSINVSQNNLLEFLRVGDNPLTTIDITNNPNLWILEADGTNISEVDTSMNPHLKMLIMEFGGLTQLDLSNNTELNFLSIEDNLLSEIDLSNNSNLEEVYIGGNPLTSVDVSNLQKLITLSVFATPITEIDVTNNPLLELLDCDISIYLEFINLQNGNNEILEEFSATDIAPNACVQVDDVQAATNSTTFPYNEWEVESTTTFSESCSLRLSQTSTINIEAYPNPTTNFLTVNAEEALTYSIFSVDGRIVEKPQSLLNNAISVEHLKSGIYFIKFQSENNSAETLKIIKR